MKIRTTKLNRANLTVQIDGISVKFNDKLEAEVTEEEALKIKAKDSSNILLEGEEATPEVEAAIEEANTPVEGAPISPEEAEALIAKRKAEKEATSEVTETETTEETTEAPVVEVATEETAEVTEGEEAAEGEEALNVADFTLAELKGLCKEENYPNKEWSNLNKEALVAYVEGKVSE